MTNQPVVGTIPADIEKEVTHDIGIGKRDDMNSHSPIVDENAAVSMASQQATLLPPRLSDERLVNCYECDVDSNRCLFSPRISQYVAMHLVAHIYSALDLGPSLTVYVGMKTPRES